MTDNTEREQFEAWYAAQWKCRPGCFGKYQDPDDANAWLYLERDVDNAWFAWQARAALPKPTATPAVEGMTKDAIDDAFEVARAALFVSPDRASIRVILDTLRDRLAASPAPMASSAGERTLGDLLKSSGLGAYMASDDLTHLHCAVKFAEMWNAPPAASVREQDAKDAARHEPYLCISPVCGDKCGQCTYAISPQDQRDYARRYAHLRSMTESGCSVFKFNGDGGVDTDDILIGGHLDAFVDAELAALSSDTQEGSANG